MSGGNRRKDKKMTTTKNTKMTMTLPELFNIMGDRINITLNKELEGEARQIENEQTALVIGLAKQMIQDGDLILRTEKLAAQNKTLKDSWSMKLVTG